MIAAIYARYSSEHQREASIEDQYRNCERRAEKEGWTITHRYKDQAINRTQWIKDPDTKRSKRICRDRSEWIVTLETRQHLVALRRGVNAVAHANHAHSPVHQPTCHRSHFHRGRSYTTTVHEEKFAGMQCPEEVCAAGSIPPQSLPATSPGRSVQKSMSPIALAPDRLLIACRCAQAVHTDSSASMNSGTSL